VVVVGHIDGDQRAARVEGSSGQGGEAFFGDGVVGNEGGIDRVAEAVSFAQNFTV
jgi:hypothetical protein